MPVPNETYNRIFQTDPDGQTILTELAGRYVLAPLVVPGDIHATLANAARHDLVLEIMEKAGQ
ncbi:MAG TPA: hypothetical protein DCZ63_08510 [Geobacter sp.]|nr:hypothetical protein [Geobacter sp.]